MSSSKSFLIGMFITLFLVLGGGAAVFIALRTNTLAPVAPTVPQAKPQASEVVTPIPGDRPSEKVPGPRPTTEACTLRFTVAAAPTPVCNSDCAANSDCPSGTVCSSGECRNPSCVSEASCTCPPVPPPPTPTCNTACTNSADCPNELACISGRCRNAACSSQADCTCPPAPKACNESCTVKEECSSGLTCAGGHCRNVSCITAESCVCPTTTTVTVVPAPPAAPQTHKACRNNACVTVNGSGTDTCTSDVSCAPAAKPQPIPPSGMDLPTIAAIVGGIALMAIGLLVVL